MKAIISIFICIAAIVFHQRDNILQQLASLTTKAREQVPYTMTDSKQQTSTSSSFSGLPVVPPEDPALNAGNMSVPRAIRQAFLAVSQAEGAGARVRRSIGTPKLRNFSPFLMLDHFSISPGAGFPDHPHRGQETITYLLSGAVDHEDFAGHKGTIETGDLQFMVCTPFPVIHARYRLTRSRPQDEVLSTLKCRARIQTAVPTLVCSSGSIFRRN
jgi:quercetin 2,3-dioxygenase